LEIGGGLGYLMRDFLSLNRRLEATMLDISPYLLKKQKENLQEFGVVFLENDILPIKINALAPFDLVIMNENLGDLPTLVAHTEENIEHAEELACYLEKATYFSEKYNLPFEEEENINIDAMEVLEKLCHGGIKYIYLSEHSCETIVPERLKPYINIES
jgi:SAM-dependent MidA family methyltransferase